MKRRHLLSSLTAAIWVKPLACLAEDDKFNELLSQLQNDIDMVETGWKYREHPVSRGVGKGEASSRKLCQPAIDLIIACEIASPAAYERKYRRPIWPKGRSGVTIGVGYDLRFANRSYLDRDWTMLPSGDRDLLAHVLKLSGPSAQAALRSVQSVDVPWPAAQAQFLSFLPYPTRQTELAFPNTGLLPDESFGALVSLVYNRGPAIVPKSPSRREMYDIQQFMLAKQFDRVPERIRSMERLWTTPDARGLVIRREAEAELFERGLRSSHA